MSDAYLKFSNTKFGSKLASMLGLPRPLELERHQTKLNSVEVGSQEQRIIDGQLLFASASQTNSSDALSSLFNRLNIDVVEFEPSQSKPSSPVWRASDRIKAVVYDARGLKHVDDTSRMYQIFNTCVKSIVDNGRVVIVGRPPEACQDTELAVVQRGLEGFSRSLAKELRHAINVHLIYLDEGEEPQLETTLRFCLSPRSAYVSGQVLRVRAGSYHSIQTGWQQPMAGQRVLVTGASQGIGLAIAETMARDGGHVICLDIPASQKALKAVAQRIGGTELALDITANNAPRLIAEAANADGGWDVVVHNAGITRDKTIAKMTADAWSQVINVNISAPQRINQALIESGGLNIGGRIVCVASISGISGNRGQTNYAFSKAGIIGLVHAEAIKLATQGYTINAVAPGFIETKMTAAMPFTLREAGRRLNSLSQGGLPVDVAEAIGLFANPSSMGLNGNVLRVCGQSFLGA